VSSYYRKGSLFSDVEEEEEEDAVVGVASSTQTLLLPSGLVYFTALRFSQPHRPSCCLVTDIYLFIMYMYIYNIHVYIM
jgi:hypothetical protein